MNRTAIQNSLRAFAWSRLYILVIGVAAYQFLPLKAYNALNFDKPALTMPFGGVLEALLAPWARWDSVWFLGIADSTYTLNDHQPAFFPLYPFFTRAVGFVFGGFEVTAAPLLIAALFVSLACFYLALYLLHRLVDIEIGSRYSLPVLMLFAFFPMSLFFSAAYSESLFLLCSVGAFYFARTGRWELAGLFGAMASATRSAGLLLIVPLAILYLWGPRSDRAAPQSRQGSIWRKLKPRYRPRADALWLLLVPAGLALYMLYLGLELNDPWSFQQAQKFWHRSFATPFGGIYQGIDRAIASIGHLAAGDKRPVSLNIWAHNIEHVVYLAFALLALAGTFKRLPFAYGAYATVALAFPLAYPARGFPLMSLPRFVLIVFPLFIWLGLACEKRGLTRYVLALFAILLGYYTVRWATWQWVA